MIRRSAEKIFRPSLLLVSIIIFSASYVISSDIELDGLFRMRYELSQNIPNRFTMTMGELAARFDSSRNISVVGEAYLLPGAGEIEIKSLYARIEDFPELGLSAEGTLLAGKARNYCFGIAPSYNNRKTADYGIVSDFITYRRVTGIQYMLDYYSVKVNFGIFNGFSILNSLYGTDGDFLVLGDRDTEDNKNKEISIRFTMKTEGEMELGFSGSSAEISEVDLIQLNTTLGEKFFSRSYSAFGIDFMYEMNRYMVQGEIFSVTLSDMESMVYEILGGYIFGNKAVYLRTGYISYGGIERAAQYGAGWDKIQISPSFKYTLRPGCWIQVEAGLNFSDKPSGARAKRNKELFTEFNLSF